MRWLLGDPAAIDVDSRISIVAIVYIAVIAPCVFILQPGYVQGLVEYLGLSEEQAGYIASAEMFGLAATTIVLNFVAGLIDWRKLCVAFLVICTAGNLLSVSVSDFETLRAMRFITGIGSGGLMSLTFAMMGLTKRSDRNFGYIITWVLTYGALGLLAMPSAFKLIAMDGVLVFFALFCASGLFFVKFLPSRGESSVTTEPSVGPSYSWLLKSTVLLAILAYNTAIGIVWAYMFVLGVSANIAEQMVANVLTVSQFLGIVGAFAVVVLQLKLGRILPLVIGILGSALGIYLLVGEIVVLHYWLGVCLFNLLWNYSMPYLLATLADFDASGKMVVYGISMQTLGYAIGPSLAAVILGAGTEGAASGAAVFANVYETGALLFVASMVLLIPGLLAQRKHLPN